MKFQILTLFPDMFAPIQASILGRAAQSNLLSFDLINIRDYSTDKHHHADDTSYGGGQGMVLLCEPIFAAMEALGIAPVQDAGGAMAAVPAAARDSAPGRASAGPLLYMSPRGKVLDQARIQSLAQEETVTILCGHYEGVDQRVLDRYDMEEVSIGDYILTGGELAAMVLVDAVARLVPGVLASEESAWEESIYSGLLEYPQYTKPDQVCGMEVPEVLLSGDHRKIYLWRYEQALLLTRDRRPDLFERYLKEHGQLMKDEQRVLEKVVNCCKIK